MDALSFTAIIRIGVILLISFITLFFSTISINVFFNNLKHRFPRPHYAQRVDTLKALTKNSVSVAIFIVVLLLIFSEIGVAVAPLLTGAGIVGFAISFGAQNLIKDLIAGFFIILENQYNIGDRIVVDDLEGEVYKITLRTTILHDDKGRLMHIPNSEIKKVIVYQKT
ncbi:MAG TPA: mechanosensitive ion channel domain-containing protein [Patescibacteria group bacterium]|nr:mechanosensitive ion channel domain-containing protein [Patescibacteria group bacterium]